MRRIVLYFGSFNPIHYGHLGLAEYVLRRDDVDEVWFVLSPHNPLKSSSELWPEQKRLRLVEEAIKGREGMRACDAEFSMPKPNYTINTLRMLAEHHMDCEFSMLMGEDNYKIFDRWRDWEEILRRWRIFVYPRRGGEVSDRSRFPQMVWLDDAPLYDISSTEIRKKITLTRWRN